MPIKRILFSFLFYVLFCIASAKAAIQEDVKGDFFMDSLSDVLVEAIEEAGIRPPLKIEDVFIMVDGADKTISPESAARIYGWDKYTLINLELSESTNRFKGMLIANKHNKNGEVISGDGMVGEIKVQGKIVKLNEVPVLNREMRSGEIITNSDISYAAYPEKRIGDNVVTDPIQLIGQSPKQRISANKIIRESEILPPILIKKGESVNMVYRTEFMTLQVVGYAMEDGRAGDLIRLKNTSSQKIVLATVSDQGVAIVNSPGSNPLVASNDLNL